MENCFLARNLKTLVYFGLSGIEKLTWLTKISIKIILKSYLESILIIFSSLLLVFSSFLNSFLLIVKFVSAHFFWKMFSLQLIFSSSSQILRTNESLMTRPILSAMTSGTGLSTGITGPTYQICSSGLPPKKAIQNPNFSTSNDDPKP